MMDGIRIIRPAALLVVLICSLMIAASAVPPLPAEFYGSVSVGGNPAPVGTGIIAKINDQIRGKLAITNAGVYGGTGIFDEKLVVAATEDDVAGGTAIIDFYVGDAKTDQSVAFEPGKIQKIDLTTGGEPGPLVADFSASPTSGVAPLGVSFTDTTTGNPVSWYWDFGDGTTSQDENPAHTYYQTGTYSVSLTVSDSSGNSDSLTKDNLITVTGIDLIVDFEGRPLIGNAPLTVQFNDFTIGNPTMWSWDFGDGGTAMVKNPVHTYEQAGLYTVSLTASDEYSTGTEIKEGYITVSASGSIVADFSASPTSGVAPLTVQFSDLSTGGPTMWSWNFGDGGTDLVANPVHTYQSPGIYTVTLTASSQTGGSSTMVKEGYITVSASGSIVADFSGSPTSGVAPLTVQFSDLSTGGPTMWSWNFGDGGTDLVANPVHTYQSPGIYTVTLTASSQTGGSSTKVKDSYITVSGSGDVPVAAFTADKKIGPKPLTVQFSDLSTGNPTMWSWDFGDGGTDMIANPVHTYELAGVYSVTLAVSNTAGSNSKTEKDYISVTGDIPPPVAMFEASPVSGSAPLTVQFTDLSLGPPTSYAWDFGDGSTASDADPTHTYTQPGAYTISLKVTNSGGSNTFTRENYIVVTGTGGIVADFAANPTAGQSPLTVQFSDLSTGSPTMWSWNFGDGGTDLVANPVHTYQSPGTYTVTLTASSQTGGSSTKVKDGYITVTSSGGIVADFAASPTSGNVPLTVQFSDQSSGSPTMWSWNFGDGGTDLVANPVHTYQSPGTYTVTLTASSQTGGSSTKTKDGYITVTSGGQIIADFSASPTSGYVPLSVQFSDLSTGGPTMWSWDFGDGSTDLVANPVHTYQSPGTYTVRLTASNQYSSNTAVKDSYITANPSGPFVPGTIKITYAPDRSQVYLNGQLQGETKFLQTFRMQNLQPGVYQLKITKPGFSEYLRDIPVAAGKTTEIVADMRIAPTQNGILSVYSYPAGSQVYVDGTIAGTTPLWLADVTPGSHSVRVTAQDYLDWNQQIMVNGGGSVTYVTAALYPSWWTPLYGYIMISSLPGNGITYLDGAVQGNTPLTLSQVRPGEHVIRIEMAGYQSWEQKVTVMEGRTAYVIAQMNQDDTTVTPMSVMSVDGVS